VINIDRTQNGIDPPAQPVDLYMEITGMDAGRVFFEIKILFLNVKPVLIVGVNSAQRLDEIKSITADPGVILLKERTAVDGDPHQILSFTEGLCF
jgi:hypothetical protein